MAASALRATLRDDLQSKSLRTNGQGILSLIETQRRLCNIKIITTSVRPKSKQESSALRNDD